MSTRLNVILPKRDSVLLLCHVILNETGTCNLDNIGQILRMLYIVYGWVYGGNSQENFDEIYVWFAVIVRD